MGRCRLVARRAVRRGVARGAERRRESAVRRSDTPPCRGESPARDAVAPIRVRDARAEPNGLRTGGVTPCRSVGDCGVRQLTPSDQRRPSTLDTGGFSTVRRRPWTTSDAIPPATLTQSGTATLSTLGARELPAVPRPRLPVRRSVRHALRWNCHVLLSVADSGGGPPLGFPLSPRRSTALLSRWPNYTSAARTHVGGCAGLSTPTPSETTSCRSGRPRRPLWYDGVATSSAVSNSSSRRSSIWRLPRLRS